MTYTLFLAVKSTKNKNVNWLLSKIGQSTFVIKVVWHPVRDKQVKRTAVLLDMSSHRACNKSVYSKGTEKTVIVSLHLPSQFLAISSLEIQPVEFLHTAKENWGELMK